jgi:hypothetical protein
VIDITLGDCVYRNCPYGQKGLLRDYYYYYCSLDWNFKNRRVYLGTKWREVFNRRGFR